MPTSALRLLSIACVACLAIGTVGCGPSDAATPTGPPDPPPDSLLSEPLGELPSKLSGVGLYRDLAALSVSTRALPYEPGFPLWSDGGVKQRFLVLPEGTSIDASAPDAYGFPSGSLLFKTFAYRTPESPEAELPVETRLLRRTAEGWELSVYGWDQDARDAELLDPKKAVTRAVLSDGGESVDHVIPSRLECRQCHEQADSPVLGMSELQLAASGSLEQLAPYLDPPAAEPPAALPDSGPLTTAVLGYLVGNCVNCHHGGPDPSSFDLRPEAALQSLIDQPTASSATAAGIRVVPGKPQESVLYLAVTGSEALEVKDMPPVGVALRDPSAGALLEAWISALGKEENP